jgi:hypothetical protein
VAKVKPCLGKKSIAGRVSQIISERRNCGIFAEAAIAAFWQAYAREWKTTLHLFSRLPVSQPRGEL